MNSPIVTRLPALWLLTFLTTQLPLAAAKPQLDQTSRLNVILLLADDMGQNGPAVYGSDLHETPNLDRLAAEGLRFTDAYAACTVCSPTRAAAMTGMYPARTHVTNWIPGTNQPLAKLSPPDWTPHLELRHTTLAEALQAAGYRTAHVGKWHLGGGEFLPENQGFNINIGGTDSGGPPGGYFLPNNLDLPGAQAGEFLTDRLTTLATEWITETHGAGHPFFMYFAYYAVHTPIQGREDYTEYYQKKIDATHPKIHTNPVYAAMHQSVDDSVGRILDTLKKLGIDDNTLILFSSDNGGLSHKLDAHGVPEPTGITLNGDLRRGKGSAYEGGHRVPLIAWWPGHIPAGSVTSLPACTIDFYPTILDITGVEGDAEHNAHVDGIALTQILRSPASEALENKRSLFWHFPHYHAGNTGPYTAIRRGDWKLIERHEDPAHPELYNLKDDLSETTNLTATNPEKTAELQKAIADWRLSVDAQMPTPNPDHDPQTPRGSPQKAKKKKT